MGEILDLETRGWRALSGDPGQGAAFYQSVLHDDCVMVFPGGLVIEGKQAILDSMDAPPWESFAMQEPRLLDISAEVKTLAYRATAQREGQPPYQAMISSTYVLDQEGWKLVHHQHTPV